MEAFDSERAAPDLLDSLGHHERAAEHRAYADLDDAAADADEVGLALELPPGDMTPPAAPAVGH